MKEGAEKWDKDQHLLLPSQQVLTTTCSYKKTRDKTRCHLSCREWERERDVTLTGNKDRRSSHWTLSHNKWKKRLPIEAHHHHLRLSLFLCFIISSPSSYKYKHIYSLSVVDKTRKGSRDIICLVINDPHWTNREERIESFTSSLPEDKRSSQTPDPSTDAWFVSSMKTVRCSFDDQLKKNYRKSPPVSVWLSRQ